MTKTDDVMGRLVETLVAAIEAGAGEWQMPWQQLGPDQLCPTNAATGRPGGNRWLLATAAMGAGYRSGTWATYRQWQNVGGQVRRGEHAAGVVVRPVERTVTELDEDTGEEQETSRITWRAAAVFHAEQVDGWEPAQLEHLPRAEGVAAGDELVARWKDAGMVIIEGGDRACYRPATDEIRVPDRRQYRQVEHWYATVAHEAGHWTGPRLGRDLTSRFGTDSYSAEELLAEMTEAVIGAHLGIEPATRQDQAAYLAGWLRILRANPRHLFTIAGGAEAAATYLLDLGRTRADAH